MERENQCVGKSMIYPVSLKTVGIVVGLFLLALHLVALWRSESCRRWLKEFPRSRAAGTVLIDQLADSVLFEEQVALQPVIRSEVEGLRVNALAGMGGEDLLDDPAFPACARPGLFQQRGGRVPFQKRVKQSAVAPVDFRGFCEALGEVAGVERTQAADEKCALEEVEVGDHGMVGYSERLAELGGVQRRTIHRGDRSLPFGGACRLSFFVGLTRRRTLVSWRGRSDEGAEAAQG